MRKFFFILIFFLLFFGSLYSAKIVSITPLHNLDVSLNNPMTGFSFYVEIILMDNFPNPDNFWKNLEGLEDKGNILFIRAPWNLMEPEKGKYAWEYNSNLKKIIEVAEEKNIRLAFSVFVTSRHQNNQAIPSFVEGFEFVDGKAVNCEYDPFSQNWRYHCDVDDFGEGCISLDYDVNKSDGYYCDCTCNDSETGCYQFETSSDSCFKNPYLTNIYFRKHYEDFVKALAEEFDDPSRVDYISNESTGYWGEHHHIGPLTEKEKAESFTWLNNLFKNNFKKVLLIGRFAQSTSEEESGYSYTSHVNVVRDGFGIKENSVGNWLSDREKNTILAYWGNRVVVGERFFYNLQYPAMQTLSYWQSEGYCLDDDAMELSGNELIKYCIDQALVDTLKDAKDIHSNILDLRSAFESNYLNKSHSWFIDTFLKEGGYIFAPNYFLFNDEIKSNNFVFEHEWKNYGYGRFPNNMLNWNNKYKLEFCFFKENNEKEFCFTSIANPKDWLNDKNYKYEEGINVSRLGNGNYKLGFGLIDKINNGPAINFYINNSEKIGDYYIFGEVFVQKVVDPPLVIDEDDDGYNIFQDCDDTNPNINPGMEEIPYNGIDDDCSALTRDDDLDLDGYYIINDCNDTNPNINPGMEEILYNGIDDDCSALTRDDDLDSDGFNIINDCDDLNASINPSAEEICDGVDNDCDRFIDEDRVCSICPNVVCADYKTIRTCQEDECNLNCIWANGFCSEEPKINPMPVPVKPNGGSSGGIIINPGESEEEEEEENEESDDEYFEWLDETDFENSDVDIIGNEKGKRIIFVNKDMNENSNLDDYVEFVENGVNFRYFYSGESNFALIVELGLSREFENPVIVDGNNNFCLGCEILSYDGNIIYFYSPESNEYLTVEEFSLVDSKTNNGFDFNQLNTDNKNGNGNEDLSRVDSNSNFLDFFKGIGLDFENNPIGSIFGFGALIVLVLSMFFVFILKSKTDLNSIP